MKLRTVHKTIRKMMSGTEGPERSALRTACACIEKSIPKKSDAHRNKRRTGEVQSILWELSDM